MMLGKMGLKLKVEGPEQLMGFKEKFTMDET